MICHGRSGDTSSASIVPVSFSRVSEIAVISDEMIVSTNAIRPGTNRFELSRVGLKRIRTLGHDANGAGARVSASLLVTLHHRAARRPGRCCRCSARWRR